MTAVLLQEILFLKVIPQNVGQEIRHTQKILKMNFDLQPQCQKNNQFKKPNLKKKNYVLTYVEMESVKR